MRREIGGYLELERFSGPVLHGGALALSSGRACLSWLIRRKDIHRILLPDFLCDVVARACADYGVEVRRYRIGPDLRPEAQNLQPEDGEWLYLVNYYGQLTQEALCSFAGGTKRTIVDNAQAYFAEPPEGMDTLYTCRKFLGVADGAFLYTDMPDDLELPADESRERMSFVLGRFERPAGEYFAEASENNDILSTEPRRMSALTWNLLHAADYDRIRNTRAENFRQLNEALADLNGLQLREPEGPYAYPLMLPNAQALRRRLIEQKIFVPMLWPNVLQEQPEGSTARRLAEDILPLPCDQRYGAEEMAAVIEAVRTGLRELQEKRI